MEDWSAITLQIGLFKNYFVGFTCEVQ